VLVLGPTSQACRLAWDELYS